MSKLKRYRATIGSSASERREWVYLVSDVENFTPTENQQLFKRVSAQAVYELVQCRATLKQSEEANAALRDAIDQLKCDLLEETDRANIAATYQQKAINGRDRYANECETLQSRLDEAASFLAEYINPHGWKPEVLEPQVANWLEINPPAGVSGAGGSDEVL